MIFILAANEIEARETSLKFHLPRADWRYLGAFRDGRDQARGIREPVVIMAKGFWGRTDTEEWQQQLAIQQATFFKEV